MDTATFWNLIETSRTANDSDCEQQVKLLGQRLAALPPEEILSFHRLFWECMRTSYDHDLWAAAYVLYGGCSDDWFDYFRGWLIGQGEGIFREVLQHPDALSAYVSPDSPDGYASQDMLGVAQRIYERKTGQEMPQEQHERSTLTGTPWKEDDLPEQLPKLWAQFGW